MPIADSGGNAWLRAMVRYLRKYLLSPNPNKELPPIVWMDNNDHSKGIHGSENQKWLEIICGLCSGLETLLWVNMALARYEREMYQHQGTEVNTASHAWQHLTAHMAIRVFLLMRPGVAAMVGQDSYNKLREYNDRWWRHERYLMNKFYVQGVGVRAVGARNADTGVQSSQRDMIALFPKIKVSIKQRLFKWTDGYCLELASQLVKYGDSLGGTPENAKLLYPISMTKIGPNIVTYWEPGADVLDPVYFTNFPVGQIYHDREVAMHWWGTITSPVEIIGR